MQKLIRVCLAISLLTLTACSGLRFPGVFRIDIGQGNIVSEGAREKLKLGMTPKQVEYVLGSAVIKDPLHPDRWDYIYNYESGKGGFVENSLTLYFESERLQRIDDSKFRNPEEVTKDLVSQIVDPKKTPTPSPAKPEKASEASVDMEPKNQEKRIKGPKAS